MGKVDWTDEASRWLRRIYEHIAADDADAAMRTVRGILGRAQLLARFPELGQEYPRHWRSSRPRSSIRPTSHRVPGEPGGDIDVLGVFHERLDIRRYLDREGTR